MSTTIIFNHVKTNFGKMVISAVIDTADDLFKFLDECYSKYGLSFKFLKEFVSEYFPKLLEKFLLNLFNRIKKMAISWIKSFFNFFL